MSTELDTAEIEAWVEEGRERFLADLKRIVELPSVSSEPERADDIRAVAELARGYLEEAGATSRIVETGGNPVVFGRIEGDPAWPTVAIYNHLDVQPAEKGKDGWTRDPWVFTEEGGRYYSRGTTDDKGPALAGLWAVKLSRELGQRVNVEFFWELEEEIGSPHFHEAVQALKDEGASKADSVVVSDTIWVAAGKPAVTRTLRGLVTVMVRLRAGKKDTHSGLCGGPVLNPLTELAALVAATCDSKTGAITIDGFAETWTPPSEEELDGFVASGFDVAAYKEMHGLELLRSEDVREVTAAIWARPTFEVHGITGGYHGPGVKTVVPPEAEAKVSFRLVPGQDPEEVYRLFVEHATRFNPAFTFEREAACKPYAPSAMGDAKLEALVEAMEYGFGKRPVFVNSGGSIGAVLVLEEILGVPVLFLPLSLPEDGYHGPDESFAWEQVPGGIKSYLRYFERIAGGV